MKKFIYALIVSIVLHITVLFFYKLNILSDIEVKHKKSSSSTQIKYVKLAPIKQQETLPNVDYKEKAIKDSKFITPPQPLPIQDKKPIQKQKESIEAKNKSTLESALTKAPSSKPIDATTQKYIDLYGEEFMSYDDDTKEFLKDNLSDIGRITQKYLVYPSISIRTRQHGHNVVEFMLHPNGDITDLKLIQSSTYSALDNNSIHTIKVAHKDYPKPQKSTKIRIFVYYKLH